MRRDLDIWFRNFERAIITLSLIFAATSCARTPVGVDSYDSLSPELQEKALRDMEAEREKLKTLDDVRMLMGKFRYDEETVGYCADIEAVFAWNLRGGCWEAAMLGRWALECIGIDSRYLILRGGKRKHACVFSNDNTIFITGNYVDVFYAKDWREAVLTYYFFVPPYKTIEEVW